MVFIVQEFTVLKDPEKRGRGYYFGGLMNGQAKFHPVMRLVLGSTDNVPPQDNHEEDRDVSTGISQPFVAKIANGETPYQHLMGFYYQAYDGERRYCNCSHIRCGTCEIW